MYVEHNLTKKNIASIRQHLNAIPTLTAWKWSF